MLSSPAAEASPGSPDRKKADDELANARITSVKRLQATWEDIYARYGAIAEDEDDVIDLRTETLVVDKGIVRNTPSRKFGTMLTEMLGPESSPLIHASVKKRRRREIDDDGKDDSDEEPGFGSPTAPRRKALKLKPKGGLRSGLNCFLRKPSNPKHVKIPSTSSQSAIFNRGRLGRGRV
jgi:hypothetical protein